MCTSSSIRHLAHEAGQALLVRLVTEDDETVTGQDKVAQRLRLEIEMFVSCQWEMVLLSGTSAPFDCLDCLYLLPLFAAAFAAIIPP